jgi:ABC-type lipoprotein export system ATPase subunit
VVFKGNNLQTLSDGDLARLRNREIGFVPQGAGLLGNLTVFDNIRAPQMFSGKDGMGSDRAAFLLDIFEIGELAHEYPYSLSGGEMRRASIARALFNAPSLLVTDEPTGDLDPENTRIVMDMLLKINEQGTAVIVVTHERKVASLGRRQYTMAHGALRRTGEKAG